jgi:hypothetical protein
MDSQKKAFVKENSGIVFAAFLVEDRIAWYRNEMYGNNGDKLIKYSIESTEALYEALVKKGYFEPDQDQ